MREPGRREALRLHGSVVGAVLGAALAGSLALAGCGDDDDGTSGSTTTLPPIGTTTTVPVVTTLAPGDPAATTTTTAPVPAGEPGTYTVVSGDTLGAIANRFGVSLADLAIANGFDPNSEDDMRTLQVGDVLTIPGAGGATTTAPVDPNATTTTGA